MTPATLPLLRFTEADVEQANSEWGCNCGPAALAACLGMTLDGVRPHLEEFERRGYMNASMMKAAVEDCGFFRVLPATERWPIHGLLRIQFTGPWTQPGANSKWAACHTHWIACKGNPCDHEPRWIFDVNGLWMPFSDWVTDVVPRLTAAHPRADGGWEATHVWEVRRTS